MNLDLLKFNQLQQRVCLPSDKSGIHILERKNLQPGSQSTLCIKLHQGNRIIGCSTHSCKVTHKGNLTKLGLKYNFITDIVAEIIEGYFGLTIFTYCHVINRGFQYYFLHSCPSLLLLYLLYFLLLLKLFQIFLHYHHVGLRIHISVCQYFSIARVIVSLVELQ